MNNFFVITVRNIRESVPKAIAYYFIRELKNIRSFILFEIVQIKGFDEMVNEDPEIAKKRKYYIDIMSTLKKSEKVMLQDDDIKKIIKYNKDDYHKKLNQKVEGQFQNINKRMSKRAQIVQNNAPEQQIPMKSNNSNDQQHGNSGSSDNNKNNNSQTMTKQNTNTNTNNNASNLFPSTDKQINNNTSNHNNTNNTNNNTSGGELKEWTKE